MSSSRDFGIAVRKEILRRRGAIRSAAVRSPGPKLDAHDVAELDRLLARLEARLREGASGRRLARCRSERFPARRS